LVQLWQRFPYALFGLPLVTGYAFVEIRGGVVESPGQRGEIRGSGAPRPMLFGLRYGVVGTSAALLQPRPQLGDFPHRSRRLCLRAQFTHPAADTRIAPGAPEDDPSEYHGDDEQHQQDGAEYQQRFRSQQVQPTAVFELDVFLTQPRGRHAAIVPRTATNRTCCDETGASWPVSA